MKMHVTDFENDGKKESMLTEKSVMRISEAPQPTSPVSHSQRQAKRSLCEGLHNHCFSPEEKNVFSPPSAPRDPPSPAPTQITDRTDIDTEPSRCETDAQGDFGEPATSSFRTVKYRYQVETTTALTANLLNEHVLQDVEKSIGDLLANRFFADQCTSLPSIDVQDGRSSNLVEEPIITVSQFYAINVDDEDDDKNNQGGRMRHRLRRKIKTEYRQPLAGMSHEPRDLVLEGDLAQACPYPTREGPCFVVGGAVTMIGTDTDGTNSSLLWVDEIIQESLQKSMNSARFERIVQETQPNVTAIRYIPPGTELPISSVNPPDSETTDIIGGDSNGTWSWALIAIGLFILGLVSVYMIRSKRRYEQEQEERSSIISGSISESQINVRRKEPRERCDRDSSRQNNQQYTNLISPSALRSNDMTNDSIALHLFHDDDGSPQQLPDGISNSWREQIMRTPQSSMTSLSQDPNQSLVQPVLNEELGAFPTSHDNRIQQSPSTYYHSAESGSASYDSGSYAMSSPTSRSSNVNSPSKLTVAFERREII